MHDTLGGALHEFAVDQLDAARASLAQAAEHPHRAVHETRKAIRRCRATIALVGEAVGDELLALDQSIRAIGKRLSRLRDAHVAVELSGAQERKARGAKAVAWATIHAALKARRDAILARTLADDPGFARVRRRIARLRRALAKLPWSAADPSAVAAGLANASSRIRRATDDAEREPTRERKHRRRRRLRRMRMQMECLVDLSRHAASSPAARQADEVVAGVAKDYRVAPLTKLADELGEELDLLMLRSVLRRDRELPARKAGLAALRRAIARA